MSLEPKAWRRALDEYLKTGKMWSEDYLEMSHEQQNIIQEVKRSLKRITYEYIPKNSGSAEGSGEVE